MPPLEDESQYTPNWRSALYSLRLLGRLHDLRAQDPKPAGKEKEGDEPTAPLLPGPIERKQAILRKQVILRKKGSN